MSWIDDLASFAKRLITLEDRVVTNAEDITVIRKDLKTLTEFTRKVAYAVKRNEERSEDKHENLVLILKLELAQLENRLSNSAQSTSDQKQKALPEYNGHSDK